MANNKVSALTSLTTPTSNDVLPIVDVLDTTQGSSGTSKKITYSNLSTAIITGVTGLTVAQGGTGVATLTSGKILTGNGTGAIVSTTTAPSGTIVGTSDTQTLTNKTLTTPLIATFYQDSIGGSNLITVPALTGTLAVLGSAQTWTATQTEKQIVYTVNAITAVSNAATVPITHRIHNVTNSSAATLTITMTTTSAVDGQLSEVRVFDFSGVAETITWVNTEDSTATAPTTSNGSTTLPLSIVFQFNSATTKWRTVGKA